MNFPHKAQYQILNNIEKKILGIKLENKKQISIIFQI